MSSLGINVLKEYLIRLQKEKAKQEARLEERASFAELQDVRIEFGKLTKEKINKDILNKMDVLAKKEKQLFKKSREIVSRDTVKEMDILFAIEEKIREIESDIFEMELQKQMREAYK